ncbi:rCG58756 [Rattus norvegicus]|uniref:RCG58756 n=1 Tax=Rattus norvegicus TaxID=10116 RepID=A6JLB3_RAT|nr:rCG58756 [Rattus norvegicus]
MIELKLPQMCRCHVSASQMLKLQVYTSYPGPFPLRSNSKISFRTPPIRLMGGKLSNKFQGPTSRHESMSILVGISRVGFHAAPLFL